MLTEDRINQIMWGAHFCSAVNGQGESVLLVLKSLSVKDKCFVDFVYNEAMKEAKNRNVLTEFELRSRLKVKNVWDETKDEYIESALARVRDLEDALDDCKKGDRRYRMTKSLIGKHKKTITAELRQKAELFFTTAEQYADEEKSKAVVFCCAHDEHENKYWRSWKDFQNEEDVELISNIARELNRIPGHETKEIRKLARSMEWRFMWNAAKGNIQSLFGVTINNFDANQRNLTYWSQVYDSVYESYERPADDVINDDEALDAWFEEQAKKNRKEQLEKRGQVGKIKIADDVRRHGEVFVVTNPYMNPNTPYRENPSIPTNEEVENLNSSFVRTFKQKEQETIKKKGTIAEKDLRSRNNKIARKTIGSSDAVIGNRNLAGKAKGKSKIVPGGTL